MRMTFIVAGLVAGASACASAKPAVVGEVAPAQSGDSTIVIGAIKDSALPRGECGMILWTLDAQRPMAILRLTSGKEAEIVVNGKSTRLALGERGGSSAFGVFEEQELSAENVKATIRMRFGLGFDGGTYLERGLLTVETAEGWQSVIPAAGVAGCRDK